MIEDAYTLGATLGLSVWCCDQAGPFPTVPYPGQQWQPEGQPTQQPHEYLRNGTAKVLTLFHPTDGHVRLKGVTACPNEVLHGWLKQELTAILATLPPAEAPADTGTLRALWERWQHGLTVKPTLAQQLPSLRMLLVLDNLAGHKTPELVREVAAWEDERNERAVEVRWRFTTADARIKLHRLYPSLQ